MNFRGGGGQRIEAAGYEGEGLVTSQGKDHK